jgi:hypothetical protein
VLNDPIGHLWLRSHHYLFHHLLSQRGLSHTTSIAPHLASPGKVWGFLLYKYFFKLLIIGDIMDMFTEMYPDFVDSFIETVNEGPAEDVIELGRKLEVYNKHINTQLLTEPPSAAREE